MEIFACGRHLLAHKTTSSALNSHFQSAMKELPQMSTFITKSFLDHSTSKSGRWQAPAAVLSPKKKKKKARSLEGPKGPRVAETCESEGPKGPRMS